MEFGGVYIPTWLAVIIPLFCYWLRNATKTFGTFRALGIKGPMPVPILGTMYKAMKNGIRNDIELRQKYGDIVGTFLGTKPVMVIYDKDILKQVMVKDFPHFQNRYSVELSDYGVDKMMTALKDDHWKHVRATISPTFSSGRLRRMTDLINRCARVLVKNIDDELTEHDDFEMKERVGAYTMDVIASTAFGLDIDSQSNPNNDFVRYAKNAFRFSFTNPRLIVYFFFPSFSKYVGFFPKDIKNFFMNAVSKAMEVRKDDSEGRRDFLQLMVNAHLEDPDPNDKEAEDEQLLTDQTGQLWTKRGLTHAEVMGQGILFFTAGYETTSNTAGFILYSLACNPDKQDILLQEIDSIMEGHDEPDYDLVREMKYLDMVVDETLRLFPPGPRMDRVAQADVTINGRYIPKGMIVGIPIYALQHDPEVWPEPQKFIPERFRPEEKQKRHQCSYMPFGMGPRRCIAMRLAQLEMKIAVVQLLRRYRFAVCDKTEIPLKLSKKQVRPMNGIHLKVLQRPDV